MQLRNSFKPLIINAAEALQGSIAQASDAIVISGIGRSGTTYLAQSLAGVTHRRTVFEPLHHRVSAARPFLHPHTFTGDLHYAYPYRRTDQTDTDLEAFFHMALKGKIVGNTHVRRTRHDSRAIWWTNTIVKMIHGNLMLAWLAHTFGCKVVLIVRNPGATIESMLRQGWTRYMQEPGYLKLFMGQDALVVDWLADYTDLIHRCDEDPFSRMVVGWCINYYVPLRQIEQNVLPAHVLSFDSLVLDPITTFDDLLAYLGEGYAVTVDEKGAILKRPSGTVFQNRNNFDRKGRIEKWRESLATEQIDKIERIVDAFGPTLTPYLNGDGNPT